MIEKSINYYHRANSFLATISINKKDINKLNVEFIESDTKKSKISSKNIILLSKSEYNKLHIDKDSINNNNKAIDSLKEQNIKLNDEVTELTNKLKTATNKIATLESTNKNLKNNNDKLESDIKEYNNKIIDILNKTNKESIILNKIINEYKLMLKEYEVKIDSYNNLGFINRLFNTKKIILTDKKQYKLNESDYNKTKYIPIDTKKE